jgi:hypothetical protein
MTMTRVERRWLSVVLSSFIDPGAGGFTLAPGEVDFVAWATRMYNASSAIAQVGMRASLLAVMLSPLFMLGRLTSFAALVPADRSALLARFCGSDFILLRGMGMLLKLAASMAIFRVASARARTNHERRAAVVSAPTRLALPIFAATAEAA